MPLPTRPERVTSEGTVTITLSKSERDWLEYIKDRLMEDYAGIEYNEYSWRDYRHVQAKDVRDGQKRLSQVIRRYDRSARGRR